MASNISYFNVGLLRQGDAALDRAYLGITGGGGTLPTGGTTGQVLEKLSNANNDTGWVTPTGGSSSYASMAKYGGF